MISQPLANIHFEGRKGKDEEIRNDHFFGENYGCAQESLCCWPLRHRRQRKESEGHPLSCPKDGGKAGKQKN